MKKLYVVTCLLFTSLISFSQDPESYPVANCTESFCVSLDATQPIQTYYKIDIAPFEFENYEAAQAKFGYITNNLLTYTVDFENQRVILQVHNERTPEPKDIVWWNNYLDSLCGL
ncbi:MAG: hypothetical protein MI810_08920 [Flavobacteriales bacterium]|nr:hypothetical protein [Flavobacteriales bacterium]